MFLGVDGCVDVTPLLSVCMGGRGVACIRIGREDFNHS